MIVDWFSAVKKWFLNETKLLCYRQLREHVGGLLGGFPSCFSNNCGDDDGAKPSISRVTAVDVCRKPVAVVMTIEVVETSDVSCSGLLEYGMFLGVFCDFLTVGTW